MRLARPGLRARLVAGAAILGVLAMVGAGLAVHGQNRVLALQANAAAAERRISSIGLLTARISDVILAPEAQRSRAAAGALQAFDALDALIAEDVRAASGTEEQTRRATQGLVLARMKSLYGQLESSLGRDPGPEGADAREAAVNSFSSGFAPLAAEQLEMNRRRRDAALMELAALSRRLSGLALGIGLAAPLAVLAVYFLLIRPLLARLSLAARLAGGATDTGAARLPLGARDELAVLFARINQATARLARRRDAVARDRARLEAIVDERTAALREANARLERADTDRRRFFADVGHELRSPLTVILAEAELASGATEDPALREALATIRTRALRLNRRVDDLLRIARSESGQLGLDRRPVDLAAVARLAADDLAPLVRKAGARIDFADAGEAVVTGDPDWLRQIAGGLIGNALKHGGPGVAVRLTTGVGSNGTFLEVTDDGPGLPEDDHARVLARFGQARPEDPATHRAGGGFGIGLTLARWVAEAHGGRLDLRSPVANGRGLAVRVTLPDSAVAGHPVPHRREEGADAAHPGR